MVVLLHFWSYSLKLHPKIVKFFGHLLFEILIRYPARTAWQLWICLSMHACIPPGFTCSALPACPLLYQVILHDVSTTLVIIFILVQQVNYVSLILAQRRELVKTIFLLIVYNLIGIFVAKVGLFLFISIFINNIVALIFLYNSGVIFLIERELIATLLVCSWPG